MAERDHALRDVIKISQCDRSSDIDHRVWRRGEARGEAAGTTRREPVTDIASERSLLRKMMGVRSQAKQGYEVQNPDAVCHQAVCTRFFRIGRWSQLYLL